MLAAGWSAINLVSSYLSRIPLELDVANRAEVSSQQRTVWLKNGSGPWTIIIGTFRRTNQCNVRISFQVTYQGQARKATCSCCLGGHQWWLHCRLWSKNRWFWESKIVAWISGVAIKNTERPYNRILTPTVRELSSTDELSERFRGIFLSILESTMSIVAMNQKRL